MYVFFLFVGLFFLVLVFLSSSLIVTVVFIIVYSLVWFFFLVLVGNQFVWSSLVTLLYLGGMMVLFTYSIMLTGVVGGDFKFLISSGNGLFFMLLVVLGFMFLSFGGAEVFSYDDEVYHFYGGVFVLVSAVMLVSVLFYCIVELVEDYV